MPVAHSMGWLFTQMAALDANPEKWWNEGGKVGPGDDDPDYDPAFGEALAVEPPVGWENLPFYDPDGEV